MDSYLSLEREFADFVGSPHAVTASTGTAALHLALAALRIGPGDEVIVPDFTMAACAFAVMYTGARPVFVDCGNDLNLDPRLLYDVLTPRTKAIMPVHVYGRPCDMAAVMAFAQKNKLFVVEDCSEAHGATWRGRPVGSFGDAGCFSLYRNKIIHAQEGGIITTPDARLAARMRDLKNMAFGERHDYLHSELAFNYRMANGQATLALDSLRRVKTNLKKREQIARWYDRRLSSLALPRPEGSVVWMYDIVCGKDDQAAILKYVEGARPFFKPMSMQPFCARPTIGRQARFFSETGVYLPVHERMTKEDVEAVCIKVVAAISK